MIQHFSESVSQINSQTAILQNLGGFLALVWFVLVDWLVGCFLTLLQASPLLQWTLFWVSFFKIYY